MKENLEGTSLCQPDYESEYDRLWRENRILAAENSSLQRTIIEMCKQMFVKGGAE